MSWQTPKTNWSAADGVRDSDFNRIESNILELYNTAKLRGTTIIYVAPNGNDDIGAGTSSSPFATVTRALRDLPNDLAGIGVNISMAFGTYAEEIVISNFYNGLITLTLSSAATIHGLTVNNARVAISGTTLTITNAAAGVMVTGRGYLQSSARIEISGCTNGVYVDDNSTLYCAAAVILYDTSVRAITITGCSFAYLEIIAGSGNAAGALSSNGSVLAYSTFNMLANSSIRSTATGGRIHTGSQSNNTLANAEVI